VAGPFETRVDWDLGAGEDWAMVFVDGDLASRVYMQAPVVIVLRRFAGAVTDSLKSVAEVVVIDDWDADELCASTEALDAAFPGRRLGEDLDVRAFSAGDLWFYTV
jgi:hypothetical protein